MTALLLVAALSTGPDAIFEAGLSPGLDSLAAARRVYAAEASPTVAHEYAIGLVNLRHTRFSGAADHLLPLRGDAEFLPGWEAALRVMASDGREAEAMADLPRLAAALAGGAATDPDAAAEMAERIGRLAAALEMSASIDHAERLWMETLSALPSDLQPRFDAGFEAVAAEAEQYAADLRARSREAARRRHEDLLRSAAIQQIRSEQATEESGELTEAVGDWASWSGERQQLAEERLSALDRERRRLEFERTDVLRLITVLNVRIEAEIRRREETGTTGRGRVVEPAGQNTGFLLLDPLVLLKAQAAQASERFAAIEQDYARLRETVAATNGGVRSDLARARSQSAEILDTARQMSEEARAAERRLQHIESELADVDVAADVSVPKPSFRRLLPWDFEAERLRLRD